jgi:hypothetical protein
VNTGRKKEMREGAIKIRETELKVIVAHPAECRAAWLATQPGVLALRLLDENEVIGLRRRFLSGTFCLASARAQTSLYSR